MNSLEEQYRIAVKEYVHSLDVETNEELKLRAAKAEAMLELLREDQEQPA